MHRDGTVNSTIFVFSFHETSQMLKLLRNGEITLPFTDVGKSCTSSKFLTLQNMLFTVIRENKILMNNCINS